MKKYVIFSMSYLGKWLVNEIGEKNIYCIIDNNSSLWGEFWKCIPIISLNEYKQQEKDYEIIIANTRYYTEIEKQLIQENLLNIISVTAAWAECKLKISKRKKIFLMNTHSYTNGGDYFITIAEKKYLSENFNEYEHILIPSMVCASFVRDLKKFISKNDLLLITGGGYLGNLWMESGENNVREIIKAFPYNRIIILPQSMYFTENDEGIAEKAITSKVYSEHNKLTICLREKNSFKVATELFRPEQVLSVPDMTLLISVNNKKKRNGIAFCFRNDKESCMTLESRSTLKQTFCEKSNVLDDIAMEVDELLTENCAEEAVEHKLDKISGYQLVVTDRLHCMLMCLATGTPCIVFDNLSGKISGTYEFIKSNEFISLVTESDDIKNVTDVLLNKDNVFYDNKEIINKYKKLTDLIINTWEVL